MWFFLKLFSPDKLREVNHAYLIKNLNELKILHIINGKKFPVSEKTNLDS